MKTLNEIRLLFWRKVLETLRQPIWIITGLTTPLLYLALFAPLLNGMKAMLGNGNVLNLFVPGILVLMAFGSGMGSGWIVIWELQTGVIERLRVTPASRFSLLMGSVLKDAAMFIPPAVLVILLAAVFGFELHWAGLAVLLVLLFLLTAVVSAISTSLGLILKQIGSLAAVVTGFQLPLTLLAGVLLPLSIGPQWLQIIAHFNPMYYVVEAARALAGGSLANTQVLLAFLVMLPLSVIVFAWSTGVYRKAVA
ncbi:MAG TPA: ABC transporter permease [Anaerolineales bacterium]|nr:ABC transporter permease [Anaerolineales bacterium]